MLLTSRAIHILRTGVAVKVGLGVGVAEGRAVGVRVGSVSPMDWAAIAGIGCPEEKSTCIPKATNRTKVYIKRVCRACLFASKRTLTPNENNSYLNQDI